MGSKNSSQNKSRPVQPQRISSQTEKKLEKKPEKRPGKKPEKKTENLTQKISFIMIEEVEKGDVFIDVSVNGKQ